MCPKILHQIIVVLIAFMWWFWSIFWDDYENMVNFFAEFGMQTVAHVFIVHPRKSMFRICLENTLGLWWTTVKFCYLRLVAKENERLHHCPKRIKLTHSHRVLSCERKQNINSVVGLERPHMLRLFVFNIILTDILLCCV